MFDMMGMLGKVKDFQAKMKEAQEELGQITQQAEAGAGMVKVLINGNRKLLKIEIDPDLIKVEDKEMLQDLVIAATNKALEAVEEKIKDQLQNATKGIIPPGIPGLDKLFS
ncbi:MAG: YbaB/EbfC family nucleoid-associated protein [Bacteroidota bacterium]